MEEITWWESEVRRTNKTAYYIITVKMNWGILSSKFFKLLNALRIYNPRFWFFDQTAESYSDIQSVFWTSSFKGGLFTLHQVKKAVVIIPCCPKP